ncbi:MAG: bifunctional riboflavin kinase/FAD synthetase [Planctomycetota bacterium]|nr:MAG: bifunctional riboflavin kinase/FAD synthetase [Planctomycetota bacterium]
MRIYRGISSIDDHLRGAVLTVGNFDGVHLGHQRILRTAHALAKVSSAAVVAMTFEPHPISILRPERDPPRLTPWDEKLHQLERAGADAVIRLATDWPLLSLSAEDFVREVLVKRIHPSYIVEGPNFAFGRGRAGDVRTLEQLSPKGGFQVRIVEPYRLHLSDGRQIVVSSTQVRALLAAGNVVDAAHCLGRPYALVGTVIHGAGAGRRLGFPTINLDVGKQLVPAEGVYAGAAEVAGLRAPAAVSIGTRPTLGGTSLAIEAFVLDESGDWYAETARLELFRRLRDQRKFDGPQALSAQIAVDVQQVREIAEAAQKSGEPCP